MLSNSGKHDQFSKQTEKFCRGEKKTEREEMVERWKQTENFAMKNHSDILWQCKKCWEMCKTRCENTRARTRTNLHLWRQAIYVHGMAPLFIQSTYSYIEFHILLLLLTHKHLSLLKQLIASEAEGGGKATPHVLLLQPSQTWVISHPKWWIVFFYFFVFVLRYLLMFVGTYPHTTL